MVAAFGLVGMLVCSGTLQTFCSASCRPTRSRFFRSYRRRRSTAPFTALSYGATPADFSGNWAFWDAVFGFRLRHRKAWNGWIRGQQNLTYVWFADRAANPAYHKPEYFLTMTYKA